MEEIVATWRPIIARYPDKHWLFTVSPIRHIKDGLHENQLSKATLLLAVEQLGDHDYNEDIYREVQKLTLDDVVAFQKEHVANRTYRYLILGNEKELDMNYLQTRGEIKRLTLEDIFVY